MGSAASRIAGLTSAKYRVSSEKRKEAEAAAKR